VQAIRRFQGWTLKALGIGLATICLVNTTVDPWRLLDLPWSADALEPYRDVTTVWSRTAKTGLARNREWDGAMFGTSRVGSAFRPEAPAFGGLRMANLGLDGGSLWVNRELLLDFLAHQDARLVLFSINLYSLYMPRVTDPADFAQSPLHAGGDRVERSLRYVVGFSTFVESVRTLVFWALGWPALHSPDGMRRWPGPDDPGAAIEGYLRTGHQWGEALPARPGLDPDQKALVEDVIAAARKEGCELVLLAPPDHALFQLAIHQSGPEGFTYGFGEARRFLAEAVARANRLHPDAPPVSYWDFDDLHPVNREPLPDRDAPEPMRYWFDLVHVSPDLADVMIARMLGHAEDAARIEPPYGTELHPADVDAFVNALPAALDDYTRDNPRDVAYMEEVLQVGRGEATPVVAPATGRPRRPE